MYPVAFHHPAEGDSIDTWSPTDTVFAEDAVPYHVAPARGPSTSPAPAAASTAEHNLVVSRSRYLSWPRMNSEFSFGSVTSLSGSNESDNESTANTSVSDDDDYRLPSSPESQEDAHDVIPASSSYFWTNTDPNNFYQDYSGIGRWWLAPPRTQTPSIASSGSRELIEFLSAPDVEFRSLEKGELRFLGQGKFSLSSHTAVASLGSLEESTVVADVDCSQCGLDDGDSVIHPRGSDSEIEGSELGSPDSITGFLLSAPAFPSEFDTRCERAIQDLPLGVCTTEPGDGRIDVGNVDDTLALVHPPEIHTHIPTHIGNSKFYLHTSTPRRWRRSSQWMKYKGYKSRSNPESETGRAYAQLMRVQPNHEVNGFDADVEEKNGEMEAYAGLETDDSDIESSCESIKTDWNVAMVTVRRDFRKLLEHCAVFRLAESFLTSEPSLATVSRPSVVSEEPSVENAVIGVVESECHQVASFDAHVFDTLASANVIRRLEESESTESTSTNRVTLQEESESSSTISDIFNVVADDTVDPSDSGIVIIQPAHDLELQPIQTWIESHEEWSKTECLTLAIIETIRDIILLIITYHCLLALIRRYFAIVPLPPIPTPTQPF